MLDNIKSSHFSIIIFSFIDVKRKLNLVKYNKSLQKKLDLDLYYYRLFSEKYTEKGSNGNIIEYSKKLRFIENKYNKIFEGEYLNGKRNGKGKEYETGRIIFEGNYLNGKRNGKGKEFGYCGGLIFEGEYLNGKRNGRGKEFADDKIIYEGDYLNDLKWNGKGYDEDGNKIYEFKEGKGIIKEYGYYDFLSFEGEYSNGLRNGNGKEYYENDNVRFEGEYLNGLKWNGKGYDEDGNKIYELKDGKGLIKEYNINGLLYFEGEYINGKRNGKGIEYRGIPPYKFFEGEYSDGKRNGKGKEYYEFGNVSFAGELTNGLKNGKGKAYYENGKLYFEGEYLYDYKHKGKEYFNAKLVYEGEFLHYEKWNGKGYDENGDIIYQIKNGNGKAKYYSYEGYLYFEGEYLNGEKNGEGKEYKYDGLKYKGEYLNGEKSGKGKEYYDKEKLQYEGEFLNGKRNGKGKEYSYDGEFIFEGEYIDGKKKERLKNSLKMELFYLKVNI